MCHDIFFLLRSASGCPLANKNKGRVVYEGSSSSSSTSPKYSTSSSSGYGSTKLPGSYGQTADLMSGLDGMKSKKLKCSDMMDTSDVKVK